MKWYWVVMVGMVVGLLSVAPYLVAYSNVQQVGDEKLHYFYQDAELVYLSRTREVTEGHYSVTSPMFNEYKEMHNIQQPFGEWLYALGSFGKPDLIVSFALFSKFLFPALLFYIVYLCVHELLESRKKVLSTQVSSLVAVSLATLVVLGYDLNNIGHVLQVLHQDFNGPALSLWTRLVNPITGALGLFGVLYLLLTLNKGKVLVKVTSAGVILGCMSGYFFSFALGMTLVGVLTLFAFIEKDWQQGKRFLYIISISLLINIKYVISVLVSSGDSELLKSGLLLTHQVLHNKVLYVATVAFLLTVLTHYFARRDIGFPSETRCWRIMAAMLISGFVCLNVQVVFGKTVWPGHFVQYTNIFGYIVFFLSVVQIYELWIGGMNVHSRRWGERVMATGAGTATGIVLTISIFAVPSVLVTRADYQDVQRYEPMLAWVRQHAGPSCVIFPIESEERLEKYVTAYTQCDVYFSSYVFAAVPFERIMHNYVVQMRLLGVEPGTADEYLKEHPDDMRRYFFEDWVDMFGYENKDDWVYYAKPEAVREAFIPKYQTLVAREYERTKNVDVHDLLTKYKIDYILIDTHADAVSTALQRYPVAYKSEDLVLYRVGDSKERN